MNLKAGERCMYCGQVAPATKPGKVCGLCGKPILRNHKWHIVESMVQHRVCEEPDSYRATKGGPDVDPA